MNDQLAKTLGIQFIERRHGQSSDLAISVSNDGDSFNFSFNGRVGKKLGDYIRVAPTETRLYIAPGCKDNFGFKLRYPNKHSDRKYVSIMRQTIGDISRFLGGHIVKYDSDLDVYYVTKGE